MGRSRFESPTTALDLEQLLGPLHRALWATLALAVAVHLAVVGVNPFREVLDKTPRPLTTRFVKRQPRLTKPLELRKVPKPRRQLLQRQAHLLSARMDQVRAAATFSTRGVLSHVAAPVATVDQSTRFASLALEPALQAQLIRGARQPESKVDLALEMLDIDAMDTGRYRAMVIQDPDHPTAPKGFFKMARVFSIQKAGGQHWDREAMYQNLSIDGLVENLNRYTGIQSEYIGQVTFDDSRILEVPFVLYMNIAKLTDQEMAGAAGYLKAGGFILGRTLWTEELEKFGGLVQGRDFHYGRIPDNHPVYQSFFDIGDYGPPGARLLSGLWIGDRLAALEGISVQSFGYHVRYGRDTTRHLQLGVNIIVYALTHEGSITQRLMQGVK